jgi:hypothetical protein
LERLEPRRRKGVPRDRSGLSGTVLPWRHPTVAVVEENMTTRRRGGEQRGRRGRARRRRPGCSATAVCLPVVCRPGSRRPPPVRRLPPVSRPGFFLLPPRANRNFAHGEKRQGREMRNDWGRQKRRRRWDIFIDLGFHLSHAQRKREEKIDNAEKQASLPLTAGPARAWSQMSWTHLEKEQVTKKSNRIRRLVSKAGVKSHCVG